MRSVLIFLRLAVFCSIFLLIFEPIQQTIHSNISKSNILILVDDSLSMTLKDSYLDENLRKNLMSHFGLTQEELAATQRIDLVNRLFIREGKEEKWFQNVLKEKALVHTFRFSQSLSPDVDLGKIQAEGKKTALGDAMIQALKPYRGKSVAAMILISDGVSNAGDYAPEEAIEILKEQEVPLYLIGVGDPEEPKDLWISHVEAPKILYQREVFTADVSIRHTGFPGQKVMVYLKLQDQLLGSENVTLGESNETKKVQFSYRFKRENIYNLTFEIQEQFGERVVLNNSATHQVEVLDKKINVLYLEGYPRWEYRYLKNALIRDKMMNVSCLLYSADTDFPQEKSPQVKTGLKSFPKAEELADFDVILFGDIPSLKVSMEDQKSILNFVENLGGGIAFISGPRSLPDTYANTPLERVIPIVIPEILERQEQTSIEVSFLPRLTPAGLEHPILRLKPNIEANKNLIEKELPGFFWFYKPVREKPGAQVLLVHPEMKDKSKGKNPLPLLTVQMYGAGSALFMGIDSTWRWRYIIGDKYFYNLWAQAIRYLSKGRLGGENKRYLLEIDKDRYEVGEAVQITLKVLDVKFNPSDARSQEVYLDREDAETGKLSGKPLKLTLKPDKNRPGYFIGSHLLVQEGTYKVWAITGATLGKNDEVSQRFYTAYPVIEYENPRMDQKRFTQLSKNFYYPHEIEKVADTIQAPTATSHISTVSEELWDKWYNLLIFLLLISSEWVLRKMNRLL